MALSPPGSPNTPSSASRKRKVSTTTILLLIFSNGVSFLSGIFYASNTVVSSISQQQRLPIGESNCPPPTQCPACPIEKECPPPENTEQDCPEPKEKVCPPCQDAPLARQQQEVLWNNKNQRSNSGSFLPPSISRIAAGMAHTLQQNFTQTFDLGVPIDIPQKPGDQGVLILYSSEKAFPTRHQQSLSKNMEFLSPEEATENCDYMNIVMTYHEGQRRQCVAIVPQYESFHVQKWMRVPDRGPGSPNYPLRMVPRGYTMRGVNEFKTPRHEKHTKKAWEMLKNYLDSIDDVLAELKPLIQRIAIDNTVVVMTCNFGQSQLLVNFACAAKSKGLDISNVLVFATDSDTHELAQSVGLNSFYDKRNYGNMPYKAAATYGDGAFTSMMLSKIMCVHMTSLAGVDLLFQDVDVLWYKNPLTFFNNKTSPLYGFDAYFQDDGSRSTRFAPYCANSGFYFLRHNERTQYFLTSFLMQSDLVLRSFSHQSSMIAVLTEHASLMGLRVKTMGHELFPSGFIFHRKKGRGPWGNYMVDMFEGRQQPYVFHMSWTLNKENKIKFYQQLDEWYLQDKCIDKKVSEIALEPASSSVVDNCCSAEALFTCHFKDKPSSRPCRDSPALDKNGRSWW